MDKVDKTLSVNLRNFSMSYDKIANTAFMRCSAMMSHSKGGNSHTVMDSFYKKKHFKVSSMAVIWDYILMSCGFFISFTHLQDAKNKIIELNNLMNIQLLRTALHTSQ